MQTRNGVSLVSLSAIYTVLILPARLCCFHGRSSLFRYLADKRFASWPLYRHLLISPGLACRQIFSVSLNTSYFSRFRVPHDYVWRADVAPSLTCFNGVAPSNSVAEPQRPINEPEQYFSERFLLYVALFPFTIIPPLLIACVNFCRSAISRTKLDIISWILFGTVDSLQFESTTSSKNNTKTAPQREKNRGSSTLEALTSKPRASSVLSSLKANHHPTNGST